MNPSAMVIDAALIDAAANETSDFTSFPPKSVNDRARESAPCPRAHRAERGRAARRTLVAPPFRLLSRRPPQEVKKSARECGRFGVSRAAAGSGRAVESIREDAIERWAAFGAALHLDRVDVPAFARRRIVGAEAEAEL